VFQAAGDRFHLIGHSYGGAIALKAALTRQDRLISLVLYEPVLFSVLMANAPQSDAVREIVAVRDDTIRLVDEVNLNASALAVARLLKKYCHGYAYRKSRV